MPVCGCQQRLTHDYIDRCVYIYLDRVAYYVIIMKLSQFEAQH